MRCRFTPLKGWQHRSQIYCLVRVAPFQRLDIAGTGARTGDGAAQTCWKVAIKRVGIRAGNP